MKLETIKQYYIPKLQTFTEEHRIHGWDNAFEQSVHFQVVADRLDLGNLRVLDVGCGVGSFVTFLEERGTRPLEYLGVDIIPDTIATAKKSHPNHAFRCLDIFSDPFEASFDLVFASGIFNLNLGNNPAFLEKAVSRFAALSGRYIAFNFLTRELPEQEETYYYYDAAAVRDVLDRVLGGDYAIQMIDEYSRGQDVTVIGEKHGKA